MRHTLPWLLAGCAWACQAAPALQPDVGLPLQAARELVLAQRYAEAMTQVAQAEQAARHNDAEALVIEQMKLSASIGLGDLSTATAAFQRLSARSAWPTAERQRASLALASLAYRQQHHAEAASWARQHLALGGHDAQARTLLVQALYQAGDLAGTARTLSASLRALQQSGQRPPESELKLLWHVAARLKNNTLYVQAIEQLLLNYPNKVYWTDVLTRLQNTPGFTQRFALDTYRLALATDNLGQAKDYVDMALLATEAGFPGEARQVVDAGYAKGVLGVGPEAERHQRLRKMLDLRMAEDRAELAAREARARTAKDGIALVQLGYNLATSGDAAKGIALIQQGLGKGGLPADRARLTLGIAQVMGGQARQAQATLRGVASTDGTGDLARLWRALAQTRATG